MQHQLLVAIKGHPGDKPPTVGDLADYLLLRPHSAVELVDRAETAGMVQRIPDQDDGRVVRVRLTAAGDRIVGQLTRRTWTACTNLRPSWTTWSPCTTAAPIPVPEERFPSLAAHGR